MASLRVADSPNSPALKRALSSASSTAKCSSPKKHESFFPSPNVPRPPAPQPSNSCPALPHHRRHSSAEKARRRRASVHRSMSSQSASHASSDQIPSFMSVHGQDLNNRTLPGHSDPNASASSLDIQDSAISSGDISNPSPLNPAFSTFHKQRGSASTSNSDNSAESSPTTTISTLDSSSMTEPSPAVSPESPASNIVSPTISETLRLRRAATENVAQMQANEQPFLEINRPGTPAKRPRNLKNLAVNTSQAYALGKAISTAQFPLGPEVNEPKTHERTSAPASPAFIKPPSPPKKRPSNLGLSIMTPSKPTNLPALAIPPTPSLKRPHMLRHFQSSPSLPLVTPCLPPEGGMQLPPLRSRPQPQGFAEVPMEDDEEPEPNFDVPQSREQQPEAYPDGPIRIYESGVDLYLEPTAEVASRYDVVMNVASEVKNPFQKKHGGPNSAPAAPESSSTVGILKESPEPQNSSPTTPKATPLPTDAPMSILPTEASMTRPEYIHIPWEHNTDIVPDLHRLVKVIDERVQQGKRVLVHCQCGVSRSASLIVAYGLYKNQALSVQEAYDAVKKRSKWIGPNMNLIMQLQEFKAGLQRNNQLQPMFGFPRKLSSAISSGMCGVESTSSPNTPRTAPVQTDASQRASTGNIPLSGRPRNASQLNFYDPAFRRSWGAGQASFDVSPSLPVMANTPYVDTKGQVVPVLAPHSPEQAPPVPPLPSVPALEKYETSKKHQEQPYLTEPRKMIPSRKSVPNFSRQLPLRSERDSDQFMTGLSPENSLASPPSTRFGATSTSWPKEEDSFNLFSPMATEFPRDDPSHALSQSAPLASAAEPSSTASPPDFAASPASSTYAITPLSDHQPNAEQVFSPIQGSFPHDFPLPPAFPTRQNVVQPTRDTRLDGLISPRSEFFGMTGMSCSEQNDGFGILSPVQSSFMGCPWDTPRQSIEPDATSMQRERSQTPQPHDYERRPSTPPALTDASSPDASVTPSPPPTRHLGSPPETGLKTKFSSPNLAEQRRLQQLQTEIESQLPPHSPELGSDDDALMSPRSEEFTKNPFHFEVPPEDPKELGMRDQPGTEVGKPSTPEHSKVDPRSPAQLGISPITRNIFDVL